MPDGFLAFMEDGVRPASLECSRQFNSRGWGGVGSGWVKSWDKHKRRLVFDRAELLVFPPWDFTPQSAQISERYGQGLVEHRRCRKKHLSPSWRMNAQGLARPRVR